MEFGAAPALMVVGVLVVGVMVASVVVAVVVVTRLAAAGMVVGSFRAVAAGFGDRRAPPQPRTAAAIPPATSARIWRDRLGVGGGSTVIVHLIESADAYCRANAHPRGPIPDT